MGPATNSQHPPYDIRERVQRFVLHVIAVYPRNRLMARPSFRSWSQLFDSASSTGAHLEEAEGAATQRHRMALYRGALREMREARYWLGLIVAGKLEGWEIVNALSREAPQLVAILSALVRKGEERVP